MVETTTQHFGWTKPEISHSPSTWGGFINTTFDSIDALVYANQQGLNPIGTIQMFGGATAPTNWLICDGRSLSTTGTYAALFAVLNYAYGGSGANFNLPNLVQKFPMGAGPNPRGQIGGTFTYALATANLPPHAHPITDVTHSHTVSQTGHTHPDPGHGHPGSTASDSGHTHPYTGTMAGAGPGAGSALVNAGQSNTGVGTANITVSVAGNYTGLQAANANISLVANGTGLSTTQNTGSGTTFQVVQPYQAVNFIIRYQ